MSKVLADCLEFVQDNKPSDMSFDEAWEAFKEGRMSVFGEEWVEEDEEVFEEEYDEFDEELAEEKLDKIDKSEFEEFVEEFEKEEEVWWRFVVENL